MRDDFMQSTKNALAARVGYRCSREKCGATTSGPQVDSEKSVNVGVAAHITAAAVGGPRYDPTLTPEERAAVENGIWLCQSCSKLIDNDPTRFTADDLRMWKAQAEAAALERIGRAGPSVVSKPDLRVLLRLPWPGISPHHMDHPVIIVEIQNHSPVTVFEVRFQLEREDKRRLQPRLDALDGHIDNVDLLSGASRQWFLSGEALFDFCRASPIRRVVAIDAVDREYLSDVEDAETTAILESLAERVRRHFAGQ